MVLTGNAPTSVFIKRSLVMFIIIMEDMGHKKTILPHTSKCGRIVFSRLSLEKIQGTTGGLG
ncbi:hypothetical protein PK28_12135 [Hymenobacter sp. DG25B]|nr:hypothetical protein PK28_12135 [Hymenobacter sp. DG25B]